MPGSGVGASSTPSNGAPTEPRTRATWSTCSTRCELSRTLFPIGELTKAEVRRLAGDFGLRTATKPDSQDVCFITSTGGRQQFLGRRIPFTPARVVDSDGSTVGTVPAIELVTVGQRKGLGVPGGGPKRYVLAVDQADGDRRRG